MGKEDEKTEHAKGERFKKAFSHSAHLLHARQVLNCEGSRSECAEVNIGITWSGETRLNIWIH